MAHVRTEVRNAIRAVLVTAMPGADVFASRKTARNVLSRPLIDMRFLNVNVDHDTMGDSRRHVASLYIRVQRTAAEDQIDNLLDADEVVINTALLAHDWTGLLEEDPELKQTNWSDSSEGGQLIGAIVIRYDIEYRVSQANLETVRS